LPFGFSSASWRNASWSDFRWTGNSLHPDKSVIV